MGLQNLGTDSLHILWYMDIHLNILSGYEGEEWLGGELHFCCKCISFISFSCLHLTSFSVCAFGLRLVRTYSMCIVYGFSQNLFACGSIMRMTLEYFGCD